MLQLKNKMEEKGKENKKKKTEWLSDKIFFENLPFLLFLTLLGILYITNSYNVEANVRELEEIRKAIVEEKNHFVNTKTKVSLSGQRNEIAQRVDTLGLKDAKKPPYIIKMNNEK
ncbi:MAG: hypothetical protein RLZZ414_986 [Bacteroidota bacterium]